MSSLFILSIVAFYFIILLFISWLTSKKSNNLSFFLGNRKSPWFVVAFGMIGTSLSGVTFISIPGVVGAGGVNQQFSYMQVVLGYLVGYIIIANVLLPLYYRLNLTSIYGYLNKRFGVASHKTGAFLFLLSRLIGASFRLFLVGIVFQKFFMDNFGIPFEVTVLITLILIWIYTFRGGIKTIVWTDTLQTFFMILAVIVSIISIMNVLDYNISDIINLTTESKYSKWFFFSDGKSDPNFFVKQFLSGIFIAIVMTGLDQDMMQKNLSCKTARESQKNMYTLSISLVFINFLFLCLGVLLYVYMDKTGFSIPTRMVLGEAKPAYDLVFPTLAITEFPIYVGIFFIIGLIAAAYSSADSALTALTTSFTVDFLNIENKPNIKRSQLTRYTTHAGFSILLFIIIVIFWYLNDSSVINSLLKIAGYTYGPLLGLFSFGIFTKFRIYEKFIPLVVILSIVLTILLNEYSVIILSGYKIGFELLLFNGAFTFLGMAALIRRNPN